MKKWLFLIASMLCFTMAMGQDPGTNIGSSNTPVHLKGRTYADLDFYLPILTYTPRRDGAIRYDADGSVYYYSSGNWIKLLKPSDLDIAYSSVVSKWETWDDNLTVTGGISAVSIINPDSFWELSSAGDGRMRNLDIYGSSLTYNGLRVITSAQLFIDSIAGGVKNTTTIAGFPLSGNITLADLTATNSTLTFTGTYNGSIARSIGLNLSNANTWSAIQTFRGGITITDVAGINPQTFTTLGSSDAVVSNHLHTGFGIWYRSPTSTRANGLDNSGINSNFMGLFVAGAERATLSNSGIFYITKVLGNTTTDAGYTAFDFNGTGRIQSTLEMLGNIGINTTTSIPNAITIGSTKATNAFMIYRTPDQVTNTEFLELGYVNGTSEWRLVSNRAGTGAYRTLYLGIATGTAIKINSGTSTHISAGATLSTTGTMFNIGGGFTVSGGGSQNAVLINPQVNNAGNTLSTQLFISPFYNGAFTGTDEGLLINAGTAATAGGTHTRKFTVDYLGNTYMAGNIGIATTTSIPNAITIGSAPSTAAFRIFRTADQVTNTEYFDLSYNNGAGAWNMLSFNANTGVLRPLNIGLSGRVSLNFNNTLSNGGYAKLDGIVSTTGTLFGIGGGSTFGTGQMNILAVHPTINSIGTTNSNSLWISPFITTTGGDTHYLINAGTNTAGSSSGTHTRRFSVDNGGNTYVGGWLGINQTVNAGYAFDVNGTTRLQGILNMSADILPTTNTNFNLGSSTLSWNTAWAATFRSITDMTIRWGVAADLNFNNSTIQVAKIFNTTGNMTLQSGGTFTDNGYKLEVVGNTRVTGSVIAPAHTVYGVGDAAATNFELGRLSWNTSRFTISTERGGTGLSREIYIVSGLGGGSLPSLTVGGSGAYVATGGSGQFNGFAVGNSMTVVSTNQYGLGVLTGISASGTGGYRALYVSPYLAVNTTTGSKLLMDVGYNTANGSAVGTHVSRFSISDVGLTSLTGKLLINQSTDAGFTGMDVNGTVRLQSSLNLSGISAGSDADSALVYNATTKNVGYKYRTLVTNADFTPTFDNSGNVNAYTVLEANYTRIGNRIFVNMLISITPNGVPGDSNIGFRVPVSTTKTTGGTGTIIGSRLSVTSEAGTVELTSGGIAFTASFKSSANTAANYVITFDYSL